jgi:TonB family protein
MNGQFLSSIPPPASPFRRLMLWSADPDAVALRLKFALLLSCLLHGALFVLPMLGESAVETRLALKGRQNPHHVINATLAIEGEHKFYDAAMPAVAQGNPEPSAPDRPAMEEQLRTQPGAEGAGLLPIPAPAYYPTDQLTKRPQPLAAADLDAEEIRAIVASGKMILKLWINEFGVVTDVVVETSELPQAFSRTAIAAFKGLRFLPGERNGQPVRTVMRIEVSYDDGRLPPQ